MRSFTALALGLTLTDLSTARIINARPDNHPRDPAPETGNAVNWLNRVFRKDTDLETRAPSDTCVVDNYYNFVYNSTFGENLCRNLMAYPTQTAVVDYTPVSTVTSITTTRVITSISTVRTTPYTTVTVTAFLPGRKRDTNALQLADAFDTFRRQNAAASSSGPTNDQVMSAALSSACNCQTYSGPTVTETYTNAPTIVTQNAFERVTAVIVTTRTAALATAFVTVTPIATASPAPPSLISPVVASSTTTASDPNPTAPPFTCPEDNNSTVSQMIGNMRYDYLVLCDTDIMNPDICGALNYRSFSECAAACSFADTGLQTPACQGFAYFASSNDQSHNCYLKSSSTNTVPALGIDSGILQRVAVGVSNSNPAGTTTEAAPFIASSSLASSDLSSSLSVILNNRSTSIPVITPGPVLVPSGRLAPGQTSYSTYVSDGTTFSTGSVFSTYYSGNGSWYSSYYTSYSLAWASAMTVYGSSDAGTAISNSTNSETSSGSAANGDHWVVTITNTTTYFPGGYNVTQVIGNETFDASGAEVTSTATTNFYSYATGVSGGSGGGGNGNAGGGAGVITSAYEVTAGGSVLTTYTVISGGGQTGGVSSFFTGGPLPTPAPSVSTITIIHTSGGTAYSTGFAISGGGGGGGSGGGSGSGASGVILPSGAPLTPISSAVFSTGISGGSGSAASGLIPSSGALLTPISSTAFSTGISGESGTAASGVIPSSGVPLTPIFSTIFSTGISGGSGSAASGLILSSGAPLTPILSTAFSTGISGESGTVASGVIPSSGFPLTLITPTPVIPTAIPLTPISSAVFSTGVSGESGTAASGVISSSGVPFTNSRQPRSRSEPTTKTLLSGSLPAGTVPPLGTGLAGSASSNFGTGSTPPTGKIFTETVPFPTGPFSYPIAPAPSGPIGTAPSSGLPVTGTAPILTAPTGRLPSTGLIPTGTAPLGTAPILTAPTGILPSTGLIPTGTAPLGTAPLGTAPLGTAPIGTAPLGTAPTGLVPTGTAPTGLVPSGTAPLGTGPSNAPFTNSIQSRSGTYSTSAPLPTAPSSCVTNFLGTTTMFTTVTEYGCYSNCAVPQGGYSPLTFGPPQPAHSSY